MYNLQNKIKLRVMNAFLFPQRRAQSKNKELSTEVKSQKCLNFELFHIDRLAIKQHHQQPIQQESSMLHYFQNKGILSSIKKMNKRTFHLMKAKSDLYDHKHLPFGNQDVMYHTKPLKRKERAFTMSNKRFSTSSTNNAESLQHKEEQYFQRKYKKCSTVQTNPTRFATIRVPKRKRVITINQLVEQKFKKKRDYETSKLTRLDIIPTFLNFSKRISLNNQRRLIKNISEKVYPYYRISPNFDALQ